MEKRSPPVARLQPSPEIRRRLPRTRDKIREKGTMKRAEGRRGGQAELEMRTRSSWNEDRRAEIAWKDYR